jgi:hypothetical protein
MEKVVSQLLPPVVVRKEITALWFLKRLVFGPNRESAEGVTGVAAAVYCIVPAVGPGGFN